MGGPRDADEINEMTAEAATHRRTGHGLLSGYLLTRCLMATLLFIVACAPSKTARRTGPAIRLSADAWSFGTIERAETVTGDIAVANEGTDTLRITLYSTCECLEAVAEMEAIPPGQSASLMLAYTGDEVKDRLTKTVFIDSNDETTPRLTITVTGGVTPGDPPHLGVIPSPLLFDPSDPAYPDAIIRISNLGRQDLEVTAISCFGCAGEWNQVTLGEGEDAELRIGRLPDWPDKRWVEIESNDPVHPVKKVGIIEVD